MNRYRLLHVTEFQYDGPVSESYNEVRLRPINDASQSCISFRLSSQPAAQHASHRDSFGNWVHHFNVLGEHRRLRIEAESVVMVHDPGEFPDDGVTLAGFDTVREEVADEHYDLLEPTAYVPHPPEVADLVREVEVSSGTVVGFARAASALIHARFRYEKGATEVHSTVRDSLSSGAGVCQDFAHLLLAMLRMRGLPGRYVSGYLVPRRAVESGVDPAAPPSMEEVIGGYASHAWAEVFVPGTGWLGLDPTLGRAVSQQHIRVAIGRDYGDVAPVRGVYKGHAGQRLSVDVRVRPAVDREGRELLMETAAGPVEEPVELRPPQQQQQQQQ
jgi:transglutaminase-like putative cysteine protease